MGEKQLVSVVMSCYRESPEQLNQSISSVLNQTYRDLELIIILDDPLNFELEQLIQDAASDARVSFIKNEFNIGLAASLNKGIGKSHGGFICRMDADDVSDESRIDTQLEYLVANELDLVGSYLNVIDEASRPLYSVSNLPIKPESIKCGLRFNNCVPHPTWFGRREVFMSGYRMVAYAEDYDFILRAIEEGYAIGNVPAPLLKYRMTEKSISRSNLYKQYLTQVALTSAFARQDLRRTDIRQIQEYVDSRYDEKAACKYAEANELFNRALNHVRQKNYLAAMLGFAQIPLCSAAYFGKVIRLFRAAIS